MDTPVPATPEHSQEGSEPAVVDQTSGAQDNDQPENDEPENSGEVKKKTRRSGRKWNRRVENAANREAAAALDNAA